MNRHARRAKEQRQRKFAEHCDAMGKESGGAFRLELFYAESFLAALMLATDPQQIIALRCVGSALKQINEADPARPPLCLTCDNAFNSAALPHAIAIITPLRDDATAGLGLGLCIECLDRFGSPDGAVAAITAKLRKSLITDLRVLPQPMAGGHA
jgi:hypothetical protein